MRRLIAGQTSQMLAAGRLNADQRAVIYPGVPLRAPGRNCCGELPWSFGRRPTGPAPDRGLRLQRKTGRSCCSGPLE